MNTTQYINKVRTTSEGLVISSWKVFDIDEANGTAWAQPLDKDVAVDLPNAEDRFMQAAVFEDGCKFPICRNENGAWGFYWNDWGTRRFRCLGELAGEPVIFRTWNRFRHSPNWDHPYLKSQKAAFRRLLGYKD